MGKGISNSDDMIDSRDVIERIEALERARVGSYDLDGRTLDDDERDGLASLRALVEQASDCTPDWEYGVTLIRDSYFKDYAMELADEIGATNSAATHGWPLNCIDWDQAARELQMDYTSVDFDGVTYWVR